MSAQPARPYLGIGEVLARLRGEFPDVSVSKIRFLESEGLIQPAYSRALLWLLVLVVAGWLLAFTLSVDDLVISSFVTGPGATTLPIVIFSKVRLGVSPEINALASVFVAFVGCAIAVGGTLSRKA